MALVFAHTPWKKPSFSDKNFLRFCKDPDYLAAKFGFSDELKSILTACFSINPEDRPSVAELKKSIDGIQSFTMQDQMRHQEVDSAVEIQTPEMMVVESISDVLPTEGKPRQRLDSGYEDTMSSIPFVPQRSQKVFEHDRKSSVSSMISTRAMVSRANGTGHGRKSSNASVVHTEEFEPLTPVPDYALYDGSGKMDIDAPQQQQPQQHQQRQRQRAKTPTSSVTFTEKIKAIFSFQRPLKA